MNRITLIALLICSHFSFGQLIHPKIVREQVLDQSLNHALISSVDNRLLSFSEGKKALNVDIYDTDSLNLLYREQIQLVENDKYDLKIEGVYLVKDQFKLVTTGFSNKSDQFGVFIYSILSNGKLSEHFQRLLFMDKSREGLTILKNIGTNPQNSLLMVHLAFVNDSDNLIDHNVFIYNDKLTNLFKLERTTSFHSMIGEKGGLNYCLGNNHLYELNQDVLYNKSIKKYQATLQLRKHDFRGSESTLTQSVNLADGFMLSDVYMKEEMDSLQVLASYLGSSKRKITGIRGVFAAKFNTDLSVKYKKSQAFSTATKAKSLTGYDNAYELDVPLLYGLNHYMTDSKGNNYLLYERTSQNIISGVNEFYYGSIIAVKINVEGVVEWDTFISKSQFFKEGGAPIPLFVPNIAFSLVFSIRFSKDSRQYLSFKPMMKNDELYFIYNDNPENEGKTAGQGRTNMININKSVPFAIHLSQAGNAEYQILKNLKIGSENQRIVYSVLSGTTLFTLRDSGKTEILQRIDF